LEQISSAVERLNKAMWPRDVGLLAKDFPFKIWRGAARSVMSTEEMLYPGEVVEYSTTVTGRASTKQMPLQNSFVTRAERESSSVEVQPSGFGHRIEVDRKSVQSSRGAGVFFPGPLKLAQRCRDKIASDYEGQTPWPPAASLFDIVRCAIAFEDPYAMAVMVAFLQSEFDVVRVKNRFENDEVEHVTPERTLTEFFLTETLGVDTDSTSESAAKSDKMYRDVLVNLRPKGSDFICEVQLTLTGISILKKSEQKIYTLARMTSPEELLGTFVFSEQRKVSKMSDFSTTVDDSSNDERAFASDADLLSREIDTLSPDLEEGERPSLPDGRRSLPVEGRPALSAENRILATTPMEVRLEFQDTSSCLAAPAGCFPGVISMIGPQVNRRMVPFRCGDEMGSCPACDAENETNAKFVHI
jgi:hypothetical protein